MADIKPYGIFQAACEAQADNGRRAVQTETKSKELL
jgi:hypothetical protein